MTEGAKMEQILDVLIALSVVLVWISAGLWTAEEARFCRYTYLWEYPLPLKKQMLAWVLFPIIRFRFFFFEEENTRGIAFIDAYLPSFSSIPEQVKPFRRYQGILILMWLPKFIWGVVAAILIGVGIYTVLFLDIIWGAAVARWSAARWINQQVRTAVQYCKLLAQARY